MTADIESKAFRALCDRLIQEHPSNRDVEDAVIELEVAHTKHVNALKREFNTDLERLEQQTRDDNVRRDRRAEEDAKHHDVHLAQIKTDYERQLSTASENYKRDLERVKAAYESLLEDGKRRSAMVSQIHDDHARELKRVKEEADRVLGNKEKEIARLSRRIEDEAAAARETIAEADVQRRLLEEDGAVLRTKLLESEVERQQAHERHREEVTRLMMQQEKIIKASTHLLNQFQNKSADLEVELSKVRAMMFDQGYQSFRAQLGEAAFRGTSPDFKKEMEAIDARKEQERRALGDVLERVTKAKEDQELTLREYQRELQGEMDKLREVQQQKEQRGDNLVVKLPSGTTVSFKTRAKSGPSSSRNVCEADNTSVEVNQQTP